MDEKDITETLRNTIGNMDVETLKSTLAYVLKLYVIDKETAYEGDVKGAGKEFSPGLNIDPPKNFTELMLELKRQYPMRELRLFSIESGRVYITLNGTRYQIPVEQQDEQVLAPIATKSAMDQVPGDKPVMPKSSAPQRFKNLEMDD